jgi:hypothetical protein
MAYPIRAPYVRSHVLPVDPARLARVGHAGPPCPTVFDIENSPHNTPHYFCIVDVCPVLLGPWRLDADADGAERYDLRKC